MAQMLESAECIAQSFHAALVKFEPNQIFPGSSWEDLSESYKALIIATMKKLLIDDIIQPGKGLS